MADSEQTTASNSLPAQLKRILQQCHAYEKIYDGLEMISFELAKALSARLVMLFLTDDQAGNYKLAHHALLNNSTPLADGLQVRFGDGLIGAVGDRAETINILELDPGKPLCSEASLDEQNFGAFVGLPIIHHANLLGILTLQRSAKQPFSEAEQAALVTFTTQLSTVIDHSREHPVIAPHLQKKNKKLAKDTILQGIASAPGITLGRAVVVYPPADLSAVPDRTVKNNEEQWQLMREALAAARREFKTIHKQAQENLPPAEQALFEVYIQMLESRSLTNEIKHEIIENQQWAAGALRRVVEHHLRQIEQLEDEYLRERADDIRDLGNRILAKLQAKPTQQDKRPKQYILVSEDVTATALLEAKPNSITGLISGNGSSNSHVAILARALRIPAVMGVKDAVLAQLDRSNLAVDGYTGQIYITPSLATKKEFRELASQEVAFDEELKSIATLPAITKDEHRIEMLVNTGLATDIKPSLDVGAEGSGLFRTEIPFMMHDRFPGEMEQKNIYQETLAAFAPLPVVMRTLDIGGDKSLPYFKIEEENPFLGWRGIRVTLDHPHIFLQQIRSMLLASIGLNNLRIMLPMISNIAEAETSIELIHRAHQELCNELPADKIKLPKIGLMIEVPAAVYLTYELSKRVDFISVGSNDLIQYLLAVDRNNPRVANLYDGLHPAMLHALQFIVKAAHRARRPASVCGELAADPLAAVLLVGMGYDSLSMNASSLPRIKWIIRNMSLKHAKQLTKEVLAIDDPTEIRCHMEMALDDMGLGGLIRAGRE